jgi:hypothetical protein
LNKLLKHRLVSPINFLKRSATVPSDNDLSNRMKQLNDKKQFKEALALFDQYKKDNAETSSEFIINQALKACAQSGDLRRGSYIHHHLPSELKNNVYILTSLIHLYSKFQQQIILLFFLLKCNVVMLHVLNYYLKHHQKKY